MNDDDQLAQVCSSPEALEILCACPDIDINAIIYRGHSLLHLACRMKIEESVRILISHPRISINQKTKDTHETALSIACLNGNLNIVQMLCAHPDIDLASHPLPLNSACSGDDLDIVNFLLSLPQIDPTRKTSNGGTQAIHCAQSPEIIKALLKHPKIDVNAQMDNGSTALSLACSSRKMDIIDILLNDPRINVTLSNVCGTNIIYDSCLMNRLHVLEKILEHDDSSEIIDKRLANGQTPLSIAIKCGHTNVYKLLMMEGRKLDFQYARWKVIKSASWQSYVDMNWLNRCINSHYQARIDLLKEAKIFNKDIATLFVLILLYDDGYLASRSLWLVAWDRFLQIAVKLPIELQMLLCNLTFQSAHQFIPSMHIKNAFQKIFKSYVSNE